MTHYHRSDRNAILIRIGFYTRLESMSRMVQATQRAATSTNRIVEILAGGVAPVVRTKGDANDGAAVLRRELEREAQHAQDAVAARAVRAARRKRGRRK